MNISATSSFASYISNNHFYLTKEEVVNKYQVPFSTFVFRDVLLKGKKRRLYYTNNYDDKDRIDFLFEYFRNELVPHSIYSKSIIRITKQVQGRLSKGFKPILICDIVKFFESIDHSILLSKVDLLKDPLLSYCIGSYIDAYKKTNKNNSKGLPVGINLSHILSEFYLKDLEHSTKSFCQSIKYIYFYRYCDNMLLLTNQKNNIKYTNDAVFKLHEHVIKLNLNIRVIDTFDNNKFSYLGYVHASSKPTLSVKRRTINNIKKTISIRVDDYIKYLKNKQIHSKEGWVDACRSYEVMFIAINNVLTGYNIKYNGVRKYSDLIPYGIAPLLSICNDYDQIKDLEMWLGKIGARLRYNFERVYKSTKSLPDLDLKSDFTHLSSIKIESLRYWTYYLKKNYYKALIKLYVNERPVRHYVFPKHLYMPNSRDEYIYHKLLELDDKRDVNRKTIINCINRVIESHKKRIIIPRNIVGYTRNQDIIDSYGVDFEDLDADQQESFEGNEWVPVYDYS